MSKRSLRYEEIEAEIAGWASRAGSATDSPKAERIVRQAASLFARYGYRRAGMDEIAREAGVAKGTLYLYFKSKAELFFRVVLEEKKRTIAQFREVFTETLAPDERLRRYVAQVFASIEKSPLSLMLLRGDREVQAFYDELDPALREQTETRRDDYIADLLTGVGQFDTLTADEKRERAQAFNALLQATAVILDAKPPNMSGEEFRRQLAKILTGGVGAP